MFPPSLAPAQGPSVQSLAFAAAKSGVTAHDIQDLSSLGNFGRNQNHVAGQLTSKFCKSEELDVPFPYFFEAPVMKKGADKWFLATEKLAVFLPHEWFAWMQSHSNVSGISQLQNLWEEHDPSDPKLHNSTLKSQRDQCLPLMVHADGGAFQKFDSITIISFRSLLSDENVSSSQMLLAAVPKSCQNKTADFKDDTMSAVWEVLTWSFSHLFYGKYPEHDHLGKAWPQKSQRAEKAGSHLWEDKLRGTLFQFSADGEFLQNDLRLPGWSHSSVCVHCKANKSCTPHNDYRPNAKWRSSLAKPGTPLPGGHPVSKVPGLNIFTVGYDTLHCLEEGVSAHTLANCLFDLIIKPGGLGAGSQDQNLQRMYKLIRQQYLELGIESSNQIKKLTLSNFTCKNQKYDRFPEITGYKARHIRYLVPVMKEIIQEYTDHEDPYCKHRWECLVNLTHMYDLMDSNGLHMSKEDSKAFKKVCDLTLLHYSRCAKLSIDQGFLQWNTVHKHHLVAHMGYQAAFMNPRFMSTYSGETMVGYQASLAHSCLNGSAPHLVAEKVLWKFRLGWHLRMERRLCLQPVMTLESLEQKAVPCTKAMP